MEAPATVAWQLLLPDTVRNQLHTTATDVASIRFLPKLLSWVCCAVLLRHVPAKQTVRRITCRGNEQRNRINSKLSHVLGRE